MCLVPENQSPKPDYPGYAEQFKLMKQGEDGELTKGLWRQWSEQSRSMHKAELFKKVKELGPSNLGGRVRTVIVDQSNPKRLFAGSVSGGFWTSEDEGNNWAPLNDYNSTLSISSIEQNPFNPKIIYYATGEIVYGGLVNYFGDGIFKSTDGGKSFSHLTSSDQTGFNRTWEIEHSKTDSNTFYLATVSNGLWRSRDGGETYEKLFSSTSDINDIDALASGDIYFTNERAGIYHFQESDTPTITKLTGGGLPAVGQFTRVLVEPSESDRSVIYAAFAGSDANSLHGIFKSTDTAKSWTKLQNRATTKYYYTWHTFMLEVSPEDPDFILMGGVSAEVSTDGGATWKALAPSHVDYHDVAFVPGTDNLYVSSDGGIYRYSKQTASQLTSNRNGGLNVTQFYAGFYFPEDEMVIAGSQDLGTSVNNSGGGSFSLWYGGDGAFNAVDNTGNIVYASSQNGNLLRRVNAGGWTRLNSALRSALNYRDFWFINSFELNPNDGTNLFFPSRKAVARSTNSGSTWTRITNNVGSSIYAIGIGPGSDPTVYFGGGGRQLYRIDNANTATKGNEVLLTSNAPSETQGGFIGNIEIDPNDPTTIYFGFSNIGKYPRIWKVLKANTDTAVWENISANLPESLPVNWIEVDPDNSLRIMIATDIGVYTSIDGGGSWQKETRVPNVYTSMLRLREKDRKLFIYTYGRGVWIANLEDESVSVPKSAGHKLSVYPNPVHDEIRFKDIQKGQIAFFDFSGKRVAHSEVANGAVSTKDIPSGSYILRLTDKGGSVRTAKVIIQH